MKEGVLTVKDQPDCFSNNVLVRISSVADGTMLDKSMGVHDGNTVSNRTRFCGRIGVDYGDVVYQRIIYGDNRSYDIICEVDDGATAKNTSEVVADALFTRAKNIGLMLPIADCVAAVIYDPVQEILALLHLGRHSTLSPLLSRVIDKFIHENSRPENLQVWLSPAAQKQSYRMEYFDKATDPVWQDFCQEKQGGFYLDLPGFNANICYQKGIVPSNIYVSSTDTVTNRNYFSHSAGDAYGRQAVVAMMR